MAVYVLRLQAMAAGLRTAMSFEVEPDTCETVMRLGGT